MSGSAQEVQELADQILELLGNRIRNGQLTIHFHDGKVAGCDVNNVHRPVPRACRKNGLDTSLKEGAG